MKKIIINCLGLIFFFVSLSANAAPIDDYVNQQAMKFMRQNGVVGLTIQLYDHGVAHSYYYGYAVKETKTPVTADTVFDIGSVTKLFTALLLALEVNNGKMQLNAPITQYLPVVTNPNSPIYKVSLLNLATHTAGFSFNTPANIKTKFTLLHYLAKWHPRAPVGSQWQYSNFGIGLLGAAIDNLYSGQGDYDKLYQRQILIPLKMAPIGCDTANNYLANRAKGYDGAGVVRTTSLDMMLGSWAMKASGADMLRFLGAAIGLPDTPPAILDAMRMTQSTYFASDHDEIGLGWEIYNLNPRIVNRLLVPTRSMPIGPIPVATLVP